MRFSPQRSQNRITAPRETNRRCSYNQSVFGLCALCLLCGSTFTACGRKGPPLAPIVYVPRAVSELTAKRVEDDVVLQFKIPTANTDNSSPADLERIEVYAHTGPLPAAADFYKYGTLVHRIDVKQPPREEPRPADQTDEDAQDGALPESEPREDQAAAARRSAESGKSGTGEVVEQGWAVSLRERLTEKHMEIGPMPPAPRPSQVAAVPVETLETPGTVNFPSPVSRFYMIVAVSRSRNRRGPQAGPIRVPLASPLAPPEKVEATYSADAITLRWPRQLEDPATPSSPAAPAAPAAPVAPVAPAAPAAPAAPVAPVAPVAPAAPARPAAPIDQETEGTFEIYADVETPGTVDAPWPTSPAAPRAAPAPAPRFGYNVYDAPDTLSVETSPDTGPRPPVVPLNAALLTTPLFSDPRVEFGTERCYVVRRVELVAAVPIESAASSPICVTPVDKFAPAAPKSLVSVATTSAVSLIWDPNSEGDIAGYVVLRGEAPGDKLAPLTETPITDAAYLDASVRRSRTYVYEIVAVDKAGNQSASSNRVEETIR